LELITEDVGASIDFGSLANWFESC
jgi:hypothetical protein